MYYICKYVSPLGGITLASDGENLTGLWDLPIFAQTKQWLDIYFSGKEPDFTPPLSLTGISPFRKRVWEILLTIPYGRTSTYGEIAKQIAAETGKHISAQAVGGAVGHNSISLIIPCHRVVGASGSLTGYAGDVNKKLTLLKMEGTDLSKLFIFKKGTAL